MATKAKVTEAHVLALLRKRYERSGNGGSGEYAFLTHVRNGAGFDANRTFDAAVFDLWPSRGLELWIMEVKVSRSDWQRERKDPAKGEAACKLADRFYIVAPTGVVKPGELPSTWGLLQVEGLDGDKPRIRESIPAPLLTDEDTRKRSLNRGFVIGLLRSCPGAIPGGGVREPTPAEVKQATDDGYRKGLVAGRNEALTANRLATKALEDETRLVDALVEQGVDRYHARPAHLARHAEAIAIALRNGAAVDLLGNVRSRLRTALDLLAEEGS